MAGGNEAGTEAETGTWGPGGNRGKGEGIYPSQGGTPLPGCEETIGLANVRYRGLAKNTERLALLLGLSNLNRAQGLLAG